MMETKIPTIRDNFPGYTGHVPYKGEIIGKTLSASNEEIRRILLNPSKVQDKNIPIKYDDYSKYNRDYFNENFYRGYDLDENKVYSNNSRDANSWIGGSKYSIYPQHIPGFQAHVPGIYGANIYGKGYSKSTAVAIKGDYCKEVDLPSNQRFKSTSKDDFPGPRMRLGKWKVLKLDMEETKPIFRPRNTNTNTNTDLRQIFKSKIASVPTPGYSGHTSIFVKPMSYLNFDKIKEQESQALENSENETYLSETAEVIVKD